MDEPAEDATALARWMTRFRVSNRELGKRAKLPDTLLGAYKLGHKRPGDPVKIAIWNATKEIEADLGVADPQGVSWREWFSDAEIAQLETSRRAANGSR